METERPRHDIEATSRPFDAAWISGLWLRVKEWQRETRQKLNNRNAPYFRYRETFNEYALTSALCLIKN
jgi:hypothetical protein